MYYILYYKYIINDFILIKNFYKNWCSLKINFHPTIKNPSISIILILLIMDRVIIKFMVILVNN